MVTATICFFSLFPPNYNTNINTQGYHDIMILNTHGQGSK